MEAPEAVSTVALILGSSQFPLHSELASNEAFFNAATQFKDYLLSPGGMGLSDTAVYDLFDLDDEQSIVDDRVTEFLSGVNEQSGAQSARDVIVYYVGHGYFAGTDYFLALRKTRLNKPYSGYPIKALAQTLRENARHSRKYLLLDCCFAAKAVAEFQGSGPLQAGVQKTVEEFEGKDPGRGTALLCASGPTNPARTPLGAPCTMFTTAMIDVLRNDLVRDGRRLSMYEVGELTFQRIKKLFPDDDPVRPEVHSPNQPDGDIAKLPLFPTTRRSEFSIEPRHGDGSTYRNALDPVYPDSSSVVHCLIVNAEQTLDSEVPLKEHVRRAWEYYGGEIDSAVSGYRTELVRRRGREGSSDCEPGQPDVVLSTLQVANAFDTTTSLTRAVDAVCRADVAVFDATDFQQAGIMFLLGIRAVARRGVTICSVGGDYTMGAELAVPFNLQMLNLAAHSSSQEKIPGSDPRDLIGKKIASGFRELANLPDYLDLPAYDAVRRLGVDSSAYRPIQYDRQVLFLCPFSPKYSAENWGRYISKELSGKLREHFRKAGKGDADPRLVRLMDLNTPRLVAQTLYESIRLTDMCVVDWTNCRANVMFEAGVRSAANPLGAVHIVAWTEGGGFQLGPKPAEHVEKMIALFSPIGYLCKPGNADVYLRMIERFEQSLSQTSDNFNSLIYRTVGRCLGDMPSPALSVADELVRSADLLLSGDYESSGICPVLYHDVSKRILDDVAEAAAERRLAAWLYLERRTPDHVIRADDDLYTRFRTLGAQSRRWLKKQPDSDLDDYIRKRMQQVRDAQAADEGDQS